MDTTKSSPNLFVSRLLSAALAIGATAWAIGATTGMAAAQTAASTAPAVTVSFADLDVKTREGAADLLRRINVAAKVACGADTVAGPLNPRGAANVRTCVREAVDQAVVVIDAPMLAAIHTGAPPLATATLASR